VGRDRVSELSKLMVCLNGDGFRELGKLRFNGIEAVSVGHGCNESTKLL
jgi:hypothetical protein